MAKCFICQKEIGDNGNTIQFCNNGCMAEYWKRLHRKYRTGNGLSSVVDTKIITGNDLMELRGRASVGIFAKVLHTRPQAINEAERLGDDAIPYPLMKKVCKYLDIEG